jgi:hypothetical protein
VGLEQGPLSLVSTIEELLQRKSNGSELESREYGRRDLSRWTCDTPYPQKLSLISPTSGGRSVGVVCSRTEATEFVCLYINCWVGSYGKVFIIFWLHGWSMDVFRIRADGGEGGSVTSTSMVYKNKTNKLRGLSPRANHTDRATASCRWS